MAQIIPFPGTAHAVAPAKIAAAVSHANEGGAPASPDFPIVRPIRKGVRIPKAPREEDLLTASFARLATSFAKKADDTELTDFGSQEHCTALHMTKIADKLPRNNLRVFSTPDDVLTGLFRMWRKVSIANLEWQLADEKRMDAYHDGDADSRREWEDKLEKADAARWIMFERLIRIPCGSLTHMNHYKLDRRFPRGMGEIGFLRKHKPELAAVLDDELERLTREKLERKTKREAKPPKA